MRPACDVALVLIWHAKCQPIQFDATRLRKVKNIFVAVVEKSFGIDRLKMTKRPWICSHGPVVRLQRETSLISHRPVATEFLNRDGFDPVNRVLQHE